MSLNLLPCRRPGADTQVVLCAPKFAGNCDGTYFQLKTIEY
jgi:hypothetical protein